MCIDLVIVLAVIVKVVYVAVMAGVHFIVINNMFILKTAHMTGIWKRKYIWFKIT